LIDVYTWPTPNGHKVHIMLEETGLAYRVHAVDIQSGPVRPEFLKISPKQDPRDRRPGRSRRKGCRCSSPGRSSTRVEDRRSRRRIRRAGGDAVTMSRWGTSARCSASITPGTLEKIEYAMNRYRKEANRLYGVLDKRLAESPYVACDEYTIADMAIMPWLRSYERQGVNMDEYPNVRRWFDKINARPAVQRGLQVLAERRRTTPLTPEQREVMFGSVQFQKR
jgi:GST-like protein